MLMSLRSVTIIVFLIKKYNYSTCGTHMHARRSLLDVEPTHACTQPPSLAPATIIHLHHQQLRPLELHRPRTASPITIMTAGWTRTLPPQHGLSATPHKRMRPTVCSKQLSAL
jgi:hypothetical protein